MRIFIDNVNWTTRFLPEIKDVKINGLATIVFWTDGTKTVVKCQQGEETFDLEKAIAMAMIKRINGNKGNYNNIFRKWVDKNEGGNRI